MCTRVEFQTPHLASQAPPPLLSGLAFSPAPHSSHLGHFSRPRIHCTSPHLRTLHKLSPWEGSSLHGCPASCPSSCCANLSSPPHSPAETPPALGCLELLARVLFLPRPAQSLSVRPHTTALASGSAAGHRPGALGWTGLGFGETHSSWKEGLEKGLHSNRVSPCASHVWRLLRGGRGPGTRLPFT